MPDPTRLNKTDKVFLIDDGAKRGPLTLFRVRFFPGETRLLGQCADRRLALWDLDATPQDVKGQKQKCVLGALVCPHELGWIRGFDIHPKGTALITGGSDRTLRLWKCSAGKPAAQPAASVQAHGGWVEAVAFAPDGQQVATVGADRLVKVWNTGNLEPIKSLQGHTSYVCAVAYSPDGKFLVSGGEDGLLIVRDARSLDELARIEFGATNHQFGQNPGHSGVHRLAISHDSRWLAAAGGDKLDVFDLASGNLVAREKLKMDVAFHPSAHWLAGGESEAKVLAFASASFQPAAKDKNGTSKSPAAIAGKVVASLKRGDWSLGIDFSRDGKRLALGKSDGTVEVHDVV